MNRDDIIRMAQASGGSCIPSFNNDTIHFGFVTEEIKKFVALVAAHEREACKKQVESLENRIAELERGEILTDKELVGAVVECVMSVTQSNRDFHCRKLQRHIIAVENERDAREEECERADKLIVSLRKQIAAEREACANLAEEWLHDKFMTSAEFGKSDIGNVIRARGEKA